LSETDFNFDSGKDANRCARVGRHVTGNAILTLISDCDVEVGAYTFEQSPGVPDTGLTGSTGVFVDANNIVIDNLKINR
jgi:hypothetical protein